MAHQVKGPFRGIGEGLFYVARTLLLGWSVGLAHQIRGFSFGGLAFPQVGVVLGPALDCGAQLAFRPSRFCSGSSGAGLKAWDSRSAMLVAENRPGPGGRSDLHRTLLTPRPEWKLTGISGKFPEDL